MPIPPRPRAYRRSSARTRNRALTNTVTYLTTGLELGGAEIQLTSLACGFAKRDWNVQVISMLPVDSPLVKQLVDCGVTVSSLEMRRGLPNPFAVLELRRRLGDYRTDVLHSHMVKANILGRIGARWANVPVQISSAHNTIEGGRWVQWVYRLTDSMADLTTNVSKVAVERYVAIGAVPRDRIRLVRNGLLVESFTPDAGRRADYRRRLGLGSSFVWLAVGRLAPQKDYDNMLEAFARLQKKAQRMNSWPRLLIVGRGPLQEKLELQLENQDLGNSVRLLGERDDVPALMDASDAYVMSSAWEGAPMVLLEAAASRLPIVATDVGGNRELVDDGTMGIIVPPGDPIALGDAMMRIMTASDEERASMGEAGRHRVASEFDLEKILDHWEHLYVELLEQNTSNG